MEDERIIAKIRKVLELSKNNPSEEEAKSAALKAQKMMAEYHITFEEVECDGSISSNIDGKTVTVGTGNKWKYSLTTVIAKNFRCKTYVRGSREIVFYGYEFDAQIAADTFTYLFDTGIRLANSYYNKLRNHAKENGRYFDGAGIKNSFLIGFVAGIREELEKQCTALMIVIPKEVNDKYNELASGFRTLNKSINISSSYYGKEARTAGLSAGKNAMGNRQLEAIV